MQYSDYNVGYSISIFNTRADSRVDKILLTRKISCRSSVKVILFICEILLPSVNVKIMPYKQRV